MSGNQDLAITDAAVAFTAAIMGAVDKDVVKPLDWWPRCRAALEASASASETWPQFVSRFGQKMQITAIRESITEELRVIEQQIIENGWWSRFRLLAQRDALYIASMAQVVRKERRTKKEA